MTTDSLSSEPEEIPSFSGCGDAERGIISAECGSADLHGKGNLYGSADRCGENLQHCEGGQRSKGDQCREGDQRRAGVLLAVLAFVIWGAFPLYFHYLHRVNPLVTLAFRAVFSLPLVMPVLFIRHKTRLLIEIFRSPKQMAVFSLTTLFIGANWGFFIWLISYDLAVMASLASFITPLISVLLGIILLRDKPAPGMWPAVFLAFAAVVGFGWGLGRFPWEGVVSSLFFSFYSLVRKKVNADSTAALCAETILFAPAAMGFLVWAYFYLPGAVEPLFEWKTLLLLIGGGILTAIPLLLFGSATKRIALSTVGMLQYICPLLQFFCATCLLREKMSGLQWGSFALLWLALIWFSWSGWRYTVRMEQMKMNQMEVEQMPKREEEQNKGVTDGRD